MRKSPTTSRERARAASVGTGTLALMAVAAGLFVASIYYHQPMLGILAKQFHTGADGVAWIAVASQVGYALGLLLLSSLGDCYERRRLIFITTMALALSLALAAVAPGLASLAVISLFVGILATAAQQVVPMAAQIAPDDQRGQVVGTVMAGLLTGILLARTVSGFISEYWGWREMFAAAGVANLVLGVVLLARLPRVEPATEMSYRKILLSLFRLMRAHATLRQAGLAQALLFASFVAFWANLALFLQQPPLSQGSTVAGLLGFLGVAGILAAPLAGRLNDRLGNGRQGTVVACGAAVVALSFVVFAVFRTSWIALFVGIVLMDAGQQAAMISNQSRVYALDASARSRLNTVYMTIMFLGGSLGAFVGAQAFHSFGWEGVCVMGALCGALTFIMEVAAQLTGGGEP